VVQGVPSSSAAVVPPAETFRPKDDRRPSIPNITTDLSGRLSQSGSISSGLGSDSDSLRRSQPSSSTRSPHTGSLSSSSLPTPPPIHQSMPSLDVPEDHYKGSLTPTMSQFAQAEAGPSFSRRNSDFGIGMGDGDMGDGMDEATRALIAQIQREDEEALRAEQERRRQLQLDEELARKEQQTEANEWQRQQMVQQERERDQILRDEQRAVSHEREIAADDSATWQPKREEWRRVVVSKISES
jgi:hypothetical protein